MSPAPSISAAILDAIIAFLAPIFLQAAGGDMVQARAAATSMLAGHNPRTSGELQLAALIIAFSFGSLDALGKAAAAELSLNQTLRLRGNAVTLHRASMKCRDTLDKLQKAPEAAPAAEAAAEDQPGAEAAIEDQPPTVVTPTVVTPIAVTPTVVTPIAVTPAAPPAAVTPAALPTSLATRDLVSFARTIAAPLSRQQRRDAERRAEKLRRSQENAAALAHRAAMRQPQPQ